MLEDKDFEEYLSRFSPPALPEDMLVCAQIRRQTRVRRQRLQWAVAAACLLMLALLNWPHYEHTAPNTILMGNAPAREPTSHHAMLRAYKQGGLEGLDTQLERLGNALIPVKRDEYM
jgi:hypothetical protein